MPLSDHGHCVITAFKVTEQVEQWICIKFYVKLEHSFVESIQMVQKAFRDDAICAAQIKMWHKRFEDGWESVESGPRSGRPATSRTPENVESTKVTNWQTGRELEADVGILTTSVSEILTQDLVVERVVAKSISQLLLPEWSLCCGC